MKKQKKNRSNLSEEEMTGIIRKDKKKITPCRCPHCDAIFLYHGDISPDLVPCPNCNVSYLWKFWTISPIKYKFLRYWRMRDGKA